MGEDNFDEQEAYGQESENGGWNHDPFGNDHTAPDFFTEEPYAEEGDGTGWNDENDGYEEYTFPEERDLINEEDFWGGEHPDEDMDHDREQEQESSKKEKRKTNAEKKAEERAKAKAEKQREKQERAQEKAAKKEEKKRKDKEKSDAKKAARKEVLGKIKKGLLGVPMKLILMLARAVRSIVGLVVYGSPDFLTKQTDKAIDAYESEKTRVNNEQAAERERDRREQEPQGGRGEKSEAEQLKDELEQIGEMLDKDKEVVLIGTEEGTEQDHTAEEQEQENEDTADHHEHDEEANSETATETETEDNGKTQENDREEDGESEQSASSEENTQEEDTQTENAEERPPYDENSIKEKLNQCIGNINNHDKLYSVPGEKPAGEKPYVDVYGSKKEKGIPLSERKEILNSSESKDVFSTVEREFGVRVSVSEDGSALWLTNADGRSTTPIDTQNLLKGNATELAVICSEIDLRIPYSGNDSIKQTDYAVMAMNLTAKLRKDNIEAGNFKDEKLTGKTVLSECSTGAYKSQITLSSEGKNTQTVNFHYTPTVGEGKTLTFTERNAGMNESSFIINEGKNISYIADDLGGFETAAATKYKYNFYNKELPKRITEKDPERAKKQREDIIKKDGYYSIFKKTESSLYADYKGPQLEKLGQDKTEKLSMIRDRIQDGTYEKILGKVFTDGLPVETKQMLEKMESDISGILAAGESGRGLTKYEMAATDYMIEGMTGNDGIEKMCNDIQQEAAAGRSELLENEAGRSDEFFEEGAENGSPEQNVEPEMYFADGDTWKPMQDTTDPTQNNPNGTDEEEFDL